MADRHHDDATYSQRRAARPPFRHLRRVPTHGRVQRSPVTTRSAPAQDERPHFRPGLRSAPAAAVQEFWERRGTASDYAFGRAVHSVLHQSLLAMQTDPVSQRLLHELRSAPVAKRTETERRLIEHEMQRASQILDTVWNTEKGNFPNDPDDWRRRAQGFIDRYVSSDDYLRAQVRRYPLKEAGGTTVDVPMLEFSFRVRTRSGIELVGRFDRVDTRKGRPVVIDYKTGPPRSMTALRHDHQMLLYAAAIADLTGARTVSTEIHWLSTGTKSTLVFSGSELRRAREEAARYVRQVERHALFGTPAPELHVAAPMPRSSRPAAGGRAAPPAAPATAMEMEIHFD